MNRESNLVIDIWDAISVAIPSAKRLEAAVGMLRAFEEYGIDMEDLGHIADNDPLLAKAYAEVAPDEAEREFDAEDE